MLCRRYLCPILLGTAALVFASSGFAQIPLENSFTHAARIEKRVAKPASAPAAATTRVTLEQLLEDAKQFPDDPIILNNLAVSYAQRSKWNHALQLSLRSVSIDSGIPETQLNLAAIYDQLGMPDHALSRAKRAAELDPMHLRARMYICDIDYGLIRSKAAAECFKNLVRDFPDETNAGIKLGISLMRIGDLAAARTVLERYQPKAPDDINLLNSLGIIYYRAKEFSNSAALLKRAVELNPDAPGLRFNLGSCYLAMKNRPGALSQYNLIKRSKPELAAILYRGLFSKYILDARR